jgi:uncharacterized protein (TIGR02145 family)
MKNCTICSVFAILFAGLILAVGCKKKSEEPVATGSVPAVFTGNYSNVLLNTIVFSGNVTADYGFIVSKRGFCWSSANHNPTIQNDTIVSPASSTNSFSGMINHLKGQMTYYVRAYATNINGTGYGNAVIVTTIDSTVTDIDDNHYRVVQVGSQIWMAENLKTTKFNDGNSIALVEGNAAWSMLFFPAYCWMNNDVGYKSALGALYNWYAINTGKLAPAGWHVPTDAEWTVLTTYLGGEDVAGGKLKFVGGYWAGPNTGATNESGFSARGSGCRNSDGTFGDDVGYYGDWWSSSQSNTDTGWYRYLWAYSGSFFRDFKQMTSGFSVRCVRD